MTDNWKEITDPEELFKLKREGWEIEVNTGMAGWNLWLGKLWGEEYKYRARPAQPKMKKVKMLCWYRKGYLLSWADEYLDRSPDYIRVPSEDKEIEVPDDN